MNDEVKMIPIEQIRILNPRHRDQKKFEVIVQSIKNLGLKMPIQVSLRPADEAEGAGYDLVCGQGRIEAFIALGHQGNSGHRGGNLKRRTAAPQPGGKHGAALPAPMDLIREIERLKAQGYNNNQIGEKLDIADTIGQRD